MYSIIKNKNSQKILKYYKKNRLIRNNVITLGSRIDLEYHYMINKDQLAFNTIRNINNLSNISSVTISSISTYFMNKPNNLINLFYILYIFTNVKPKIIKSKKSVAGFKLRKNMLLGLKTDLYQKESILNLIDRLQDLDLKKRVLDGKSLNISGENYNIFKELDYEIDKGLNNKTIGFDISLVFSKNITSQNKLIGKYLNIY